MGEVVLQDSEISFTGGEGWVLGQRLIPQAPQTLLKERLVPEMSWGLRGYWTWV